MLNLHLLECTVKGYDHISDLLFAKYWVITGCKYEKCKNLISVTIGSAVTSINHQAFHDCPALAELYCHATTPPTIIIDTNNSTFDSNIKDKATLYVPLRCQTKYKSSNWGTYFTSIKEMD